MKMKRILAVILSFTILFALTACERGSENIRESDTAEQTEENRSDGQETEASEETANTEEPVSGDGSGSNILVAYFSRVGNMEFDESVDAVSSASINMEGSNPSGNAELLARMAQETTDGDLFFIETTGKYPAEYRATTDQAKDEQNEDARPEIVSHVENMDAYDTVVLIYPNWWGTLPQPVFTFLEEYDFSGKTILPLCTHEGSGLGRSEDDIASLCPDARLSDGLAVRGSDAGSAQAEVEDWIRRSEIME